MAQTIYMVNCIYIKEKLAEITMLFEISDKNAL